MPHITDNELALYAFDPQFLPPSRREDIEREVASCVACGTTLEFMTVAELELADPDLWEPLSGSPTLDALRGLAARIAAEDEEAEALLAHIIAAPAVAPWSDLATKRCYQTGGVVRKLIAEAATLHEREPLQALRFADAAISIADALPADLYPASGVYELRGTAWKERANALTRLGRFDDGLEACRRAESAYQHLIASALGLATVAYVRAGLYFMQQRYEDAQEAALLAEDGFVHVGDEERATRAIHLQGLVAYERGQLREARGLFQRVHEYGHLAGDTMWIARTSQAIGLCSIELGDLRSADMYLQRALKLFRDLDLRIEITRTEWGLARAVLASGRTAEAISQLRAAAAAFEKGGMLTDAALVGLDLADALIAANAPAEIGSLAAHLFRIFNETGMVTGALSAVAYLKEAAERGPVARSHVEVVRRFLRRVDREPQLLFVPPPEHRLE